jgi:arylsulfatase A-like enzyme
MLTRLLLLLCCGLICPSAWAQKATGPTNVLVLMADDLGWNGVSYHNPKMTTPALAKLAKEGVQLERFYGYPVCSPARSALLSGMMPRRFGVTHVVGPGQQGIPKGTPTLASSLQKAGYSTSLVGKWHLGTNPGPLGYGFERFYGFTGAEVDYFKHTNQRGQSDWWRDNKQVEEEGYTTTLLADEAVQQLKKRDPKKPFYLQVAFNAPHATLAAPKELTDKHKDTGLYNAVVDGLDQGIGRILTTLDELGLRENTLVIFFSDNGASRRMSPNTPLKNGKDTVNEGGIRTPAIVRWPGKAAVGAVSQQPIAVNDLFPTIFAALDLPLPNELKLDGSNQWPALSTGKMLPRPAFLIASQDIAFIDGDWKIIETADGQRSLYNLAKDIGEANDLATEQPGTLKSLGAKLDELKKGLPVASERRGAGPAAGGGAGKGPGAGGAGKGLAGKGKGTPK